jgi:hypothetical protein
MKKLIVALVALIFLMFSFGGAMAKNNKSRSDNQGQRYRQEQQRDNRGVKSKQRHQRNYRDDGYRYRYKGHRRHNPRHSYRGHWRSWRQWDNHRHYNHNSYEKGRYYREGGSLYFEFETDEGRFVFSIGR